MKVVCLVPSWTETLIRAGVNVVGRSRYCIHPAEKVAAIPVVGGTKQADWETLADLQVDLVVLDREENTKEMADSCSYNYLATHVDSVESMRMEMLNLSRVLNNTTLKEWAEELEELIAMPAPEWKWREVPGTLEVVKDSGAEPRNFVYLIWRKPWMAVGKSTFIASMLKHFGGSAYFLTPGAEGEKYPRFDLEDLNPQETLLLCSSEPYPFAKKKTELQALPFSSRLVDGELWSWFGIRALEFLKAQKNIAK